MVIALGVDLGLALQSSDPGQVLFLLDIVGVEISVHWRLMGDMNRLLAVLLDGLDELFLVQTPGALEELKTQCETGVVLFLDVGVQGLVAGPALADIDLIEQLADLDEEWDGFAVAGREMVEVLGTPDADLFEAGELLGKWGGCGGCGCHGGVANEAGWNDEARVELDWQASRRGE